MIYIENNIELAYSISGLFWSDDEWLHPRRKIDTYEIIYMLEGTAYIQEEDRQYVLKSGDVLLLYPDRIHFGYNTSTGKTSFYWAHFLTTDFNFFKIELQYFSAAENYRFNSLFKQLLHIANTADYPKYSSDLIMGLIINEISAAQHSLKNKSSKLINDVAEWTRINCGRKITVETIADYFGYNADYLSGLFKKSFGIGLKQYINNEKIKLAKNLLITSNYTIKQISNILNWDGENQFINYFKYHEGMSPTKYRNIYINTHFNNK
ncbi:MAG: transcriptional regulator, AraC family [Eubacterium sp.]|jgi:AraC-like DNA-binding protein|nr:transcriptional regulator, AraC family [Eubacterium sp.]